MLIFHLIWEELQIFGQKQKDIKELYQEIILDHGKNPRNKNICKDFNKDAKGHNPLCGDKVHIFLLRYLKYLYLLLNYKYLKML